MKVEKILTIIGILLQIFCNIFAVIGMLNLKQMWIGAVLIVNILVSASLGYLLYKNREYIKFVEFLSDNQKHNFMLLPKLRLYLNSNKINNDICIHNLKVEYIITATKNNDMMGDLYIKYHLVIENRNLPSAIHFVCGNDYSDSLQKMRYKYGKIDDWQPGNFKQRPGIPYWREKLLDYKISIDKQFIPESAFLYLEIEVDCARSFEFEMLSRDTIICLPKIFSDDIRELNYEIKLQNFNQKEFYCDAYTISKEKDGYEIVQSNCFKKSEYLFVSKFNPNKIRGEKAYYFRLGLSENDEENYSMEKRG